MSRFLLGSPAAPGDAPASAGPGAAPSPAPRTGGAVSDDHSDEEPDWLRLFSPPPPAAAVPLPESSSEEDIMPVRKLVARAADEAGPSHAAQAPPAATKATILARPSAPEGPAPAKTPGAKGGKAAKEKPTGPVVSVPLLIDRLAKGKVLAELEGEGDAVDLEGDVGAVGRLYMTGAASRGPSSAAAQPELRLDLKGVIYEARMVACTSCMVVRIEHQEAKVESVMNQYMAVRREAFTWGDDDGGLQDGFAYGDTSSSGGSGKRKRQADAGAAGGGGGSDDDDDVSSDSGGKAKKSAAKKAKTPKAGATPRSKGPKPKGKAKAKPRKSKIKVNR